MGFFDDVVDIVGSVGRIVGRFGNADFERTLKLEEQKLDVQLDDVDKSMDQLCKNLVEVFGTGLKDKIEAVAEKHKHDLLSYGAVRGILKSSVDVSFTIKNNTDRAVYGTITLKKSVKKADGKEEEKTDKICWGALPNLPFKFTIPGEVFPMDMYVAKISGFYEPEEEDGGKDNSLTAWESKDGDKVCHIDFVVDDFIVKRNLFSSY